MKFTLFIAGVILACSPVAPARSIPLTPALLNQTDMSGFRRVQPIPKVVPLSATPNGIIALTPVDEPIETTSTGLPFETHPDNIEDFPHVMNNIDGSSEMAKPNVQSHDAAASPACHHCRNQPTKQLIADETMAELLENKRHKGKAAPTDARKGFERHPKLPMIEEIIVKIDDTKYYKGGASPTDLPKGFEEYLKRPNSHLFKIGGVHRPAVHPDKQDQHSPEPMRDSEVGGPHRFGQHLNNPKYHPFGMGGHEPVVGTPTLNMGHGLVARSTQEEYESRATAAPTDLPHRFSEHPKIPNWRPWGARGPAVGMGYDPVVHPKHAKQREHKVDPSHTSRQSRLMTGSMGYGLVSHTVQMPKLTIIPILIVSFSNCTGGPLLDLTATPTLVKKETDHLPLRRFRPGGILINLLDSRGLENSTEVGTDIANLDPNQLVLPGTAQRIIEIATAYRYFISECKGAGLNTKSRYEIYNYLFNSVKGYPDNTEASEPARRLQRVTNYENTVESLNNTTANETESKSIIRRSVEAVAKSKHFANSTELATKKKQNNTCDTPPFIGKRKRCWEYWKKQINIHHENLLIEELRPKLLSFGVYIMNPE